MGLRFLTASSAERRGSRAGRGTVELLAAYNGRSDNQDTSMYASYALGIAVSDDSGRSLRRVPQGRILQRSPTASDFDSGFLKDPSLAKVGRRLFMAYTAAKSTDYASGFTRIGIAIWNNGIPVGAPDVRQLLLDSPGSGWDGQQKWFPCLFYDEDTGILHLFYSGEPSTTTWGSSKIGHATIDPNTLAVTKDASPIISPSGSERALQMGCVYKDPNDGTWHMWTSDFNSDLSQAWVTHRTAPAATGPWSKKGIVYNPRTSARNALTANASLGDTTVQVADSSVFTVGDAVFVQDNLTGVNTTGGNPDVYSGSGGSKVLLPDNWEVNYVAELTDGTHVKLRNPTKAAYTTANSAEIVAVDQTHVMARSVIRDGDRFAFLSTAWYAGNQTYHEIAVRLVADDLDDNLTLDRPSGVLLEQTGSIGATRNAWDKTTAENVFAIPFNGPGQVIDRARRSGVNRVLRTIAPPGAITSTNWRAVGSAGTIGGSLDCIMPAQAGDLIRITPALLLDTTAAYAYFDVALLKTPAGAGTYLSSWVGGTTGTTDTSAQGIMAWRAVASENWWIGPPVLYTVKDTDLDNGLLIMRPMVRTQASGRTILGAGRSTDVQFSYENLGGGDAL